MSYFEFTNHDNISIEIINDVEELLGFNPYNCPRWRERRISENGIVRICGRCGGDYNEDEYNYEIEEFMKNPGYMDNKNWSFDKTFKHFYYMTEKEKFSKFKKKYQKKFKKEKDN
jgi:hypothetical protein